MEAVSWPASSPATNGHPATPVTSARFPSWVTFDDNEVSCPLSPVTSPLKPNPPPTASVIPDVPYHPAGSFKKRERPKSTLMNFSKVQKLDISLIASAVQPPQDFGSILIGSHRFSCPPPYNHKTTDCSSSKFQVPASQARCRVSFCVALFIMVGNLSHKPPRDIFSEAIDPEVGHGTPGPVTAEGSGTPCAIPGGRSEEHNV